MENSFMKLSTDMPQLLDSKGAMSPLLGLSQAIALLNAPEEITANGHKKAALNKLAASMRLHKFGNQGIFTFRFRLPGLITNYSIDMRRVEAGGVIVHKTRLHFKVAERFCPSKSIAPLNFKRAITHE